METPHRAPEAKLSADGRKLVVTGMAGISPLGNDWDEVSRTLKALESAVVRMDEGDASSTNVTDTLLPEIAIIGASQDLGTISGQPLKHLKSHGYKGALYPVNPRYSEVAGEKCYRSLDEVPETPDLVLILVNASRVTEMLRQCGAKGVPYVIIFSSGFSEVGGGGIERGTSTLFVGAPGTGKSTVAVQFAIAAAQRDER